MVSMLDCIERFGVIIPTRAAIWFKISAPSVPIATSAMMSTLTWSVEN